MDFSRARTVLIGVFLFLNIFLLYQIWQDEGRGDFAFLGRKEEVSRLETALRTAGFSLEASLPRDGMRLAHLVVEPWQFDAAELVLTLWTLWEKEEGLPPVVEEASQEGGEGAEGGKTYSCGGYSIHVEKEGLLVVAAKQKKAFGQKIDNQEPILKTVQEIIQKTPFLQGFIFDYAQETEKGTVLYYRQEYEELPLYGGYLELLCGEKGKIVFSLYRLEPRGFAAQTREIISPAAALLRFLETYKPDTFKAEQDTTKRKSITEIALGFYSHGYDAERWEIPPVWRIRLGNGEIYYVNAFTGNLEK